MHDEHADGDPTAGSMVGSGPVAGADDSKGRKRGARRRGRASGRDRKASAETPEGKYTIDELSAKTAVPSRTIRFYQAKGALPAPERHGRVAVYGDHHVERLELVAQLQDRGLSLRAIRDLLASAEGSDVSVSEWLGLGDKLRAPWSDDQPRLVSEQELHEMLGEARRPGLVAELVDAELIRREGMAQPPSYVVPSPRMLDIALRLDGAGLDLQAMRQAEAILRKQLGRGADEIVAFFLEQIETGDEAKTPDDIGRIFDVLRSISIEAVELIFKQEVERALQHTVEQGHLPTPRQRRKKRK